MKASRFPSWAIVVLSALFGAALLGTATLASMSLRQRDAAVREGILLRAGHSLENLLRGSTPDEAGPVLEAFLAEHADAVAGVAVAGPAGVVASAGADTTARSR